VKKQPPIEKALKKTVGKKGTRRIQMAAASCGLTVGWGSPHDLCSVARVEDDGSLTFYAHADKKDMDCLKRTLGIEP